VCDRCSSLEEVIETMNEANQREQEAREGCERDLRQYRARITKLTNELERERGQEAEGKIVEEIISYWKTATGHPGAKVSQVGERALYVRKALHFGYTVAELKRVCDVAGVFPYVDPRRSKHPSGRCSTGETLRDDIPTLFKNEMTIDRLLDLGSQPVAVDSDEPTVSISTAEQWRRLNYPQARVMAALWDLENLKSPNPDTWTADCPVHFGPGLIARRSEQGLMNVECVNGCDFWRLLAALDLQPSDLFENAEQDPVRQSATDPRPLPAHLDDARKLLIARLSG
jgi:hypothetical protein